MPLDDDTCYRALASRDRRFEGRFVVAVRTTGVYCRPGCPARLPRRENTRFLPCAAAAEEQGFRACRRCRPDAAVGTPAWSGTSAVVSRALRLIDEGCVDAAGVEGLALRLGLGDRQVRRLFAEHLGASPVAVARTRRVHFARRLLDQTALPVTAVADAAGFRSLRTFHEAFQQSFGCTPREVRAKGRPAPSREEETPDVPTLRLPWRAPYDAAGLFTFLATRAVPGMEEASPVLYRRTVRTATALGIIEVRPQGGGLQVVIDAPGAPLLPLVATVQRLFDLAADTEAIAAHLRQDPVLAPHVTPGLRVPGCWDPFELAVRAVLGQQVSVAAARTLCRRIVEAHGERLPGSVGTLTHVFPRAVDLVDLAGEKLGLTGARAKTLRALARAVAEGALRFDTPRTLDDTIADLTRLPGIGPWTAHYIALRAFGEPDAFPTGDLGLRHALAQCGQPSSAKDLGERAESWRPWRAYAVMALWHSLGKKSAAAEDEGTR